MLTRTTQKTRRPSIPEMITEAGRMLSNTVQNAFEPMDFLEGLVETPSEAGSTSYRADRTKAESAFASTHKRQTHARPLEKAKDSDLIGVGSLYSDESGINPSMGLPREASDGDLPGEDLSLSRVSVGTLAESNCTVERPKTGQSAASKPLEYLARDQREVMNQERRPVDVTTGPAWGDWRNLFTGLQETETCSEGFEIVADLLEEF